MGIGAMLDPVRTRRGGFRVVLYSLFLFVLFLFIGTLLSAIALRHMGLKAGELLLFAGLQAMTLLSRFDWILLVLISVSGGLLMVNYIYRRCPKPKSGEFGLALGTLAATCPACLAPFFGLAGVGSFLGTANYIVKFASLGLILGGTYWIAQKAECVIR